ncbi:uncharacterized protein [Paramisgurnus dabryanus]|uniref:uncharacterized protein n=1 Tax=Paramisgurnus dabryanus TaxID=90735 RepID=UPI0031F46E49
MPTCCVVGCENRTSSGVNFFRIPAGSHPFQKNRRNLWLRAIKRADWDNAKVKEARVCSAHFISGEASLDSSSPDFVPSLFVYKKQTQIPQAKMERYHRKMKRDEYPKMQPAPSTAEMEQDCPIDHCNDEEEAEVNHPVSSIEVSHQALPLEDQLLMVLMKLRMGLRWGGRVSDKQITKESGFLELLEPMDEVLADRGFLIRDELAAIGATLRIPHFTKGKKQLSAGEVDMLDDVVIVCAALTNLCKSVVPKGRISK